ncbi:hypothetical protein DENIS_4668 [Desulfonema ishimotonii]|uniref:Uncharacterized protein n=1 Tax=Desulfonema ishimotonii TaxID=45657 RepID=A0A401G362_9BACT|nr:hypothetical protein [Desulfonema ishimotonii]GBC63670.1 hypothetical protein DENIS_4668 [Desulfonema ishimotonii]
MRTNNEKLGQNSKSPEMNHTQNNCVMDEKRLCKNRRKKASEGYTWISTVGWICRRAKKRRDDDDMPC